MLSDNLIEAINQSQTISLFSHIKADGDAVGSVMALYNYCKSQKKQVFVFLQEPISSNFNFLGIDKVVNKKFLKSYDLAIGLDCPNIERFGIFQNEFKKAKYTFCIDHHIDNENFADVNIVNCQICSTCEILFNIFVDNGVKLTSQTATCLYSGIASDTGRFMHSNTNCSAFYSAGRLIEYGADIETINYVLFNHKSFVEFDIFRKALNNIEFYEDGKIAFVGIDSEMLYSANATVNDTFLITEFVKGIDKVDISVLMTEYKKTEQMVSIRTNHSNAQAICKSFGGGGHFKASGCRLFTTFDDAKKQLLNECKKELKK